MGVTCGCVVGTGVTSEMSATPETRVWIGSSEEEGCLEWTPVGVDAPEVALIDRKECEERGFVCVICVICVLQV